MAKMPWLKLYTEIRTDPKMQALSDLEFRTWVNILCLSAESKVRGIICIEEGLAYPIEGLARTLFISTDELTSCLNKFQKLRMIDVSQDETIAITHFDDRQYEKPSDKPEEVAKRVGKHRAKKSNTSVTLVKREENAIEEEGDRDKELDKELDTDNNNNNAREEIEITVNDSEETVSETMITVNELNEIVSKANEMAIGTQSINWAEKNWGRMIPKGEADSMIAWCDEFLSRGSPEPDAVVIEGLRRCLDADVRKMHYLKVVLTDWREAGVLTVAQVEAREIDRKSQKEHKRNKDPGDKPRPPKNPSNKYHDFYL